MSAGTFVRSRYQATYDTNAIHPIRVQPETIAASIGGTANDPPAGAANSPISALSSIGSRARGLKPRMINIQFPATGQPTGYKALGVTSIVALTAEFWALAVNGAAITYLGVTCTVIGRTSESAD